MAEYWKSTPRYWCKHCAVYVRDTALERSNHEATGRHQGALRRSLRDLHRDAEREERDKERARREVARLNGLVSESGEAPPAAGGSGDGSGGSSASRPAAAFAAAAAVAGGGGRSGRLGIAAAGSGNAPPGGGIATQSERERQLEQLALLGVNIPTELRRNMALAGDWTVTSSRVIDGAASDIGAGGVDDESGSAAGGGAQGRVVGVKRERERTEEEMEQEEAIKGLTKTKKPRRMAWGVGGGNTMPGGDGQGGDHDLDALLSGPLVRGVKKERADGVKREEDEGIHEKGSDQEAERDGAIESEQGGQAQHDQAAPAVKDEGQDDGGGSAGNTQAAEREEPPLTAAGKAGDEAPPMPMFKKRKPKTMRQK